MTALELEISTPCNEKVNAKIIERRKMILSNGNWTVKSGLTALDVDNRIKELRADDRL